MSDTRKYVQTPEFTLSLGSILGATSIRVNDFKDIYGNSLTMADFGTKGHGTLEPNSSREEAITFTSVTDNSDGTWTIGGISSALAKDPYTETSGLVYSHTASKTFIISNTAPFYGDFLNKNNDETVTGSYEFPDPINAQNPVTKAWFLANNLGGPTSVDATVVSGTAGETLSTGNLVYLKLADQRWYKTDADDTATFDAVLLGIAQGAGTAGNAVTDGVLLWGNDTSGTYTAGNNYYLSNTAGAVVTTADQTNVVFVGFSHATNKLFFNPKYTTIPTYTEKLSIPSTTQKQALAGTQGVPSSSNLYVTADNVSMAGSDQSQTTQNAAVDVAEANATSRKNKVAQSFVAGKTKVRGIELFKIADTGTFTGTVTISIQADTAGSPSGSALVSKTITNAQWLVIKDSTAFISEFTTEYSSLVIGTTYWIVIEGSTSDTLNHFNIGTNSAGGYANGSVKYYNVTDGWVAIATIDLYFKVLEGIATQIIEADSSGKIPNRYLDIQDRQLGISEYLGCEWFIIRREFTYNGWHATNNTPSVGALWSGGGSLHAGYAFLSGNADFTAYTGYAAAGSNASALLLGLAGTGVDATIGDLVTNQMTLVLEDVIRLSSLVDGDFFFGFSNASSVIQYNVGANAHLGVMFRSDGTMYLQSCQGASVTATAASGNYLPEIPPGLKKLMRVRIEWDAGSAARLYINGSLVASHSTNLPTSGSNVNILYSFNEITAGSVAALVTTPILAIKITP